MCNSLANNDKLWLHHSFISDDQYLEELKFSLICATRQNDIALLNPSPAIYYITNTIIVILMYLFNVILKNSLSQAIIGWYKCTQGYAIGKLNKMWAINYLP